VPTYKTMADFNQYPSSSGDYYSIDRFRSGRSREGKAEQQNCQYRNGRQQQR